MKHYSFEDWVDLATESLPDEQRTAMLGHVEDCHRCWTVYRVWKRTAAIGRSEAAFTPPDDAVRAVKSAYRRFSQEAFSPRRRVLAQLVFDSFRAPAAVGVRTLDLCSRQLRYEVDDLSIDIRIETRRSSARSSLIGQLLHPDEEANLGEIPVALVLENDCVARTVTNPFGEFSFEHELTKSHRIGIQLDESRSVVVPLPCLDDPSPSSREQVEQH